MKNMKTLKEHLNESQNGKIYVVVLGENHEGIYELIAAYSNEREANRAMKEYEKNNKVADSDYLEVVEVNLY